MGDGACFCGVNVPIMGYREKEEIMNVTLTDRQMEMILTLVQDAREKNESNPSEVARDRDETVLRSINNAIWDVLQDGAPNPWG